MDEAMVAREIADIVLAHTQHEGAQRIGRVHGWVASNAPLLPDSLQLHFDACTRGTLAEGARLDIRATHVDARCNGCGGTYPFAHRPLVCPHCGFDQAELIGQTGVGVDRLDPR